MIAEVVPLRNGMVKVVFVPCPQCTGQHTLTVRQDELEDYYANGSIGLAFPNMKIADRELFMTGMADACFKQSTEGEF